MKIDRRTFLTGGAAATALTFLPRAEAQASVKPDSFATLIDISKCDGCEGKEVPMCVSACREGRKAEFPEPPKAELRDYWPQKKHEDWSGKRHISDRFTPYNWIFVQHVKVGDQVISIPRRCMHCDSPACSKLCPFGVNHKTPEGPVYIDQSLCFGGAKCRTVCPWSVPQRQAGVGIYTLWQKYLPVGGGVMFKCDLCRGRLAENKTPLCIENCPKQAMQIGRRDAIYNQALQLKEKYNGDIYGMSENSGTSTIYVSKVPFADIDKALIDQGIETQKNKVVRLHKPENILEKQKGWALLSMVSPLLGAVAAVGLSGKDKTEEE